MAAFNTVTHVIFDLDGTLLDTQNLYMKADAEICSRYGKKFTNEIGIHMAGLFALDACQYIVSQFGLPITAEEYYNEAMELYRTLLPTAKLLPGAEQLIRHMHAHGVPIAVATSSSSEHVKIKTTNHGELFSLMNHIVSGTSDPEVKAGKPAPDIFLVCASRFPDNPPPSNVLVFEDAPNGVIAARTAGMQSVMVPEDYVSEDKCAAATLVLKSLEDFQPELFGLPPF